MGARPVGGNLEKVFLVRCVEIGDLSRFYSTDEVVALSWRA
jgi:hypothetical protein